MGLGREGNVQACSVAIAVLASACTDTIDGETPDSSRPPPADISLLRPHIEMGVEDGLQVCGWSLDYAERFIELYTRESLSGNIDVPVEYYYLNADTIHLPEICGSSSACARHGVVFAQSPVFTHEIVHAVRQLQHGGVSPGTQFFEEGIAQWHCPVGVSWDEKFSPLDLPSEVGKKMPAELYDPAAQLMSIVAAGESDDVAEALVDASAAIEVADDVELVVADVLGMSLSELSSLYDMYPNCSAGARARLLVECAEEPEVWREAPWSNAPYIVDAIGEFNCEDPRVIGPLEGRLWTFLVVEVATDGLYSLDIEEAGQGLQLTQCDQVCGSDIDLSWEAPREEDLMLSAGRYVARISREFGDERRVGFRLRGPLP